MNLTTYNYKINPKSSCLGFYWIDPNLGVTDDAVRVYCNMTAGGETCIYPDVHASRMPNIPWRKSHNGWYSTLRGGFRISYDSMGSVQMTFLRLMSTEAYQNFTYTCLNSAAWYDQAESSYSSAIQLQGENEDVFSAKGANQPAVLMDGCKVCYNQLFYINYFQYLANLSKVYNSLWECNV